MTPSLLSAAERLLERTIRESSTAQKRLDALDGRSFRVVVSGVGVDVLLVADGGRLRVLPGESRAADVTVRGTPFDLSRLVRQRNIASHVHGSGVELTGRVHVAEHFAELLRLALPDLEEELARWVGDVPAHRAGNAARGLGDWLGKAIRALRLDTAEYLTEESRLLPTRYEAEALFTSIDRVRDDVERAEARLDRLRKMTGVHDAREAGRERGPGAGER